MIVVFVVFVVVTAAAIVVVLDSGRMLVWMSLLLIPVGCRRHRPKLFRCCNAYII